MLFFLYLGCKFNIVTMSDNAAYNVSVFTLVFFLTVAVGVYYFCSSFERFRGLLEVLDLYDKYRKWTRKTTYSIVMKVHPDLRCTVSWSHDFEKKIEQNMSVLKVCILPITIFVILYYYDETDCHYKYRFHNHYHYKIYDVSYTKLLIIKQDNDTLGSAK